MDSILFWNGVALEANRVSHTNGKNEQTGPPRSARALAIVHLAMYDAYASINQAANLPPYIGGTPVPPGASSDPAVAGAAHKALTTLFPSQKPFFDLALAGAGDTSDKGHNFGMDVAQKILDDRAGDPGVDAIGYKPPQQRGAHRPDPDNPTQGYHAPFYGARSKGFAIKVRNELKPPPFDIDAYREALRKVRYKGIAPELMGTLPPGGPKLTPRTVDETLTGTFWAYDGASGLGTPPRLYNQIVREVAKAQGNSEAKNARLFAFLNVAMADAGILAWDQKYKHNLWRPVLGIREHDESMGPEATQATDDVSDDCDSSWLPLGAPNTNSKDKNVTPPFPAYPSGHATFGAAAFHITRLFYGVASGDKKPDTLFKDQNKNLKFVSEELNGINTDNKGTVRPRHVREFPRGLWQMIEENGFSRVYLGVHWIFDAFAVDNQGDPDLNTNIGGVPLGLAIAEDIFQAGGGKAPKKSTVPPRP